MNLDDLLPDARLHLPGAPDILVRDHLRQSAIRFCRDTHIWQEELAPVYPYEGATRYQLALPEGAEVLSIKSAVQNNSELQAGINVFGLLTLPNLHRQDPVTVVVVLQPTAEVTELPSLIIGDYRQGIVSGAVETLSSMPGKDWSNPAAAGYHWNQYYHHVQQAKQRVMMGNSSQSLRVRPQPFL